MDEQQKRYPLSADMTVDQVQEACRSSGEMAAVRTVRACAQWFRVHTAYGVAEEAIHAMEQYMLVDVARAYEVPPREVLTVSERSMELFMREVDAKILAEIEQTVAGLPKPENLP
jgi:hypothetical protein